MTCRMAAGKQKKRMINSTNSEQNRPGKKPKVSSNHLISLKSQISLKWDDYQKMVVPKKEQVGILWSDLAPFIESSQKHCSGLGDITYVPPEAFSLGNLRRVLSYEVWATCLTEAERKFLMQFLPSETDAKENVHLLLTGKNHHFGSPSLSWSSSLCDGDIHPDAVLNKEKQIRANEKAYHVHLNNYHSNMVGTLKKWRKRWLSCDDPEKMFRDNLAKHKQEDMRPKATGSEMPLKIVHNGDISKFMSYIEISRTQHNLVKNLKQSGDGIQTKHLTRVLGDLDKFHVKPYGTFIDDEKRRLREHWLNIWRNELPAALEVLRDRKMQIQKLTKLLALELGEKNVSVIRKADQLAGVTKELGQRGACENGNSNLQSDLLEHSSQDVFQGGNCPLQDHDDDDIKYMETSIDHSDSDSEEHFDVQDQDLKDISCVDSAVSFGASSLDEQSEDPMDMKLSNDGPDVHAEDIVESRYTDTAHSLESHQVESTSISTPTHTLDSQHAQAVNIEGIACTAPSIHAHEQDQRLKGISYKNMKDNGHGVIDIPSANSYPEMNAVTVDQEVAENTTIIPSTNSPTLFSKSLGDQILVEQFHLNDQVAKSDKDVWQLSGPLDSYYHPLEDITYSDSGNLQIRHGNLSAGQQGSVMCSEASIVSQQQSQVTIASAFPIDNPASFMQPCSKRQSTGQLQTIANEIGMNSYSLEHTDDIERSTDLHSLVNNGLAQSTSFPGSLQEQQLIHQSHNGLYVQQLDNNLYSCVRFPAKGNPSIIERHTLSAGGPMDHRYNSFSEEHQSHNSWSAMESNNCFAQALPGGSNTDGSLFSALAPYKQPSLHMQSVMSSPNQLLGIRSQVHESQNFVPRTQVTNPRVPNMYGYTQNLPSSTSSHVASVGSLNSMQWTNLIQQNPGMPDFTSRQFRGPWTR